MTAYLPRPDGERIAYRRLTGSSPTVVWLGGFNSDMNGSKAEALHAWAQAQGRAYVRFDYFGHGASSGRLAEGDVSRWRGDALAVIEALTSGPLILVGSSMGGFIAVLAALALAKRVSGLVLVAPAADMTDKLIEPSLSPEARAEIETRGVWVRPSPYGAGDPISRRLIKDGRGWAILPGPVECDVRLRVLQGGEDEAVPWRHALALAQAWRGRDVAFTLVRDGDHRLSRPKDILRLIQTVEELLDADD